MRKAILILVGVVSIFVSCDAKKSTSDASDDPKSLNGTWEVTFLGRTRLPVNELFPDKKPFILFNTKESKVSGSTGCNSFTGNIGSMSAGKIRFDENMAMTKMFCQGDGENLFVTNLKLVENFTFTDNGKTLLLKEKDDIDAFRLTKK